MKKFLLAVAACAIVAGSADAQLYLIGEPAGGWSPQKGIELEKNDYYTYKWTGTIGASEYFAFATNLLDSDDWDKFNDSYRLSPETDQLEAKSGEYALHSGKPDNAFKGNGINSTYYVNWNSYLNNGSILVVPKGSREFDYEYEGQTLTYSVLSEEDRTVMVVGGNYSYGDYGNGHFICAPDDSKYNISGDLVIPKKVTDGDNTFTVVALGTGCFAKNKEITSVTLPESVNYIGDGTFYECRGLTAVNIPDGVSQIGSSTFLGCSCLTSITIPNGVTKIGIQAFAYCYDLTAVNIPDGVTAIGEGAFSGCNLTSVTIPEGITIIENDTFNDCNNLTSVSIPEGVTSIGSSAFESCHNLTSVTIPEGVTKIGDRAFRFCNLTSVNIPKSVKSIGRDAFEWSSDLNYAEFASIESLCNIDFGNEYSNPLCDLAKLYIDGKEVTEIIIPESISKIKPYTFTGCSGLTSVTIPEGVTSIGSNAFERCYDLTSVNIPEGVTEIGSEAFYNTSLKTLYLPESLTYIGERAFNVLLWKSSLASIYYPAYKPIECNSNIFSDDTYNSATLYLSEDGELLVKNIEPWNKFANIKSYDPAGIDEISADFDANLPYEVYNLNGIKVGNSIEGLSSGIFIVRQGKTVKKISVK
ncbi:MAG: leucine-rich repeat protein [Bacteroides sp.]|nr:leucine-rich repeat protein [Bacteroides sp.]